MVEKQQYEVVVTKRASLRFDAKILPYLLENFSLERAIEIEDNLIDFTAKLSNNPSRGTLEKELKNHIAKYRFILFRETRNIELKVIYHIKEDINRVYVTDFFPVKMNNKTIKLRS